ncbi:MAG: sigma-E factor negative regulatory protein [Pseudomonadota bacterium]
MDTTRNNNSISALVDGELGYAEGSRAVERLLEDSNSQDSLQRYQLIGACMRGEDATLNGALLFDRIHQQLEQEPTVLAPAAASPVTEKPARRHHNVVKFALAASVATLMVVSVFRLQGPLQGVPVAGNPDNVSVTPSYELVADIAASKRPEVAAEAEIDRYLMGHQIYSSGAINPDFAATMVSF